MSKCVIIPGRQVLDVWGTHWYMWVKKQLEAEGLFETVMLPEMMPDPITASEKEWVPFIRDEVDEDTVVVGHSSGAQALMRLCEETKVKAMVLVSACHSDLGDPSEAAAGYYSRPWRWERIKANCGTIVQFHSDNDPNISISEARHVAENLDADYYELEGRAHYLSPTMPEVVEALRTLAKGTAKGEAPASRSCGRSKSGWAISLLPGLLILAAALYSHLYLDPEWGMPVDEDAEDAGL